MISEDIPAEHRGLPRMAGCDGIVAHDAQAFCPRLLLSWASSLTTWPAFAPKSCPLRRRAARAARFNPPLLTSSGHGQEKPDLLARQQKPFPVNLGEHRTIAQNEARTILRMLPFSNLLPATWMTNLAAHNLPRYAPAVPRPEHGKAPSWLVNWPVWAGVECSAPALVNAFEDTRQGTFPRATPHIPHPSVTSAFSRPRT